MQNSARVFLTSHAHVVVSCEMAHPHLQLSIPMALDRLHESVDSNANEVPSVCLDHECCQNSEYKHVPQSLLQQYWRHAFVVTEMPKRHVGRSAV